MWIDEIRSRVQEDKRLKESDIIGAIEQALNEYSGYYPNNAYSLVISNGTSSYDLPNNWSNGFSVIHALEYPLAENLLIDNPQHYPIPAIRELSDYFVQNEKLYIQFSVPDTESFRVYYTVPYTMDSSLDIAPHHQSAIINLATSYALTKLGVIFAQTVDYQFDAEAVDYKDRNNEYIKQATWYRNRWEQVMGLGSYAANNDDNAFEVGTEAPSYSYTRQFNRTNQYHYRMFQPTYEREIIHNPT